MTLPRWTILLLFVALIGVGFAAHMGWLRDPELARADYVGTIDVSADDAKHYRAVAFEWKVESKAGTFTGKDTTYVRVDGTGERATVCGWLRMDKGGASIRAARWLSEARLNAGELKLSALFIAPVEKLPGDGLNAGCARLDQGMKPAADVPLSLEGRPVRE